MSPPRANTSTAVAILMVCVGVACLYLALDGLATGSVTAASRYILNPTSATTQPLRYWFDEVFWFGLGIYLVLWPIFRSRRPS